MSDERTDTPHGTPAEALQGADASTDGLPNAAPPDDTERTSDQVDTTLEDSDAEPAPDGGSVERVINEAEADRTE